MLLKDNKATFYRHGDQEKTPEGKVRNGSTKVLLYDDVDCNIQFEDGYPVYQAYGITGEGYDAYLYVEDKRIRNIKPLNLVVVEGVEYEVQKNIKYSTHCELLLKDVLTT